MYDVSPATAERPSALTMLTKTRRGARAPSIPKKPTVKPNTDMINMLMIANLASYLVSLLRLLQAELLTFRPSAGIVCLS